MYIPLSDVIRQTEGYYMYMHVHMDIKLALYKTVPIMCVSCASYTVIFPHPTAIPQPAATNDMEPEATCKLAMLCG